MKKRKGVWIISILIIVLSSFVLAGHLITTSVGGTSYNYNEDISNIYNITVNNTDLTLDANITQVNITLPSNFSFIFNSSSTDAIGTFSNTSSILTWDNSSGLVMNLTWNYFAFNATGATPGNYNIIITTTNATGIFSSNISVTINDTTAPLITFNAPLNGANLSQNYIIINITATDNVAVDSIILRFYNSTNSPLNTTTSAGTNHYVNITNLSEGVYYYNATVNDSKNNINNSVTRSLRLDRTNPSIDLSENDDGEDYLNITISITESGSGVNTCTDSDSGTTISGSGTTRYLYEDDLECGESYSYNVTCTDFAGNSNSRSESFSTESCDDSSSSSSTSTTTTTSFWKNSYLPTEQQVEEGYSKLLKKGERVRVKIGTESHYVGIIKLTSTKATINISSTPQQAEFIVGETKSFEVTNDSYYDVKVKLNSVNSTTANITTWAVHEKISSQVISEVNNVQNTSSNTTNLTSASKSSLKSLAKNSWFWTGLGVVVLVILGIWYYLRRRKRTKGY